MHKKRLGRGAVIAGAAFVALTLAACTGNGGSDPSGSATPQPTELTSPSATPNDSASGFPSVPTNKSLEGITVTGAFGTTPTVTFTAPWAIDTTQSKVLSAGNGAEITADSTIEFQYQGVNGRTGVTFDENFTKGTPAAASVGQFVPGFSKSLVGKHGGDRILMAITGADGYDSQGGQSSVGIEVGDTLVFVVDIIQVSLTGPSGTPVTPPAGLPTVSGPENAPVITIDSKATPPSTLVVQPLITGTGKKVAANKQVLVNYAEYAWSTGKLVKQTYGYAPLSGSLSSTIQGWQTGLVDQPVGSRVLLIVPPNQAYPEGNPDIGVAKGETMVYVIDILFTN